MNFYDTSSLLLLSETALKHERFGISEISLIELENIKSSTNKDELIKEQARKVIRILSENIDDKVVIMHPGNESASNDYKILMDAKEIFCVDKDMCFVTNDLAQKMLAKCEGFAVSSVVEDDNTYSGYLEVVLNEVQLIDFYSNPTENTFELETNEYIILKDIHGQIIDKYCWTGAEYRPITYSTFSSKHFGDIKPMKNDIYQQFLFDSLMNNKITLVRGAAGTGKSYISLGYLMYMLERGRIDRIVIFCNTVATKGSARLGFYPGTREDKLLDSQIGNMLASKFGSRIEVERMVESEKIILLPMSDIRGYDTSGMRAGVYITEAQNLDINLMKLALQRIGEDSVCVVDGDEKAQVDDVLYAGRNNGMRRLSQVFRGESIYGEIELKNVHRSKIAQIAEKL